MRDDTGLGVIAPSFAPPAPPDVGPTDVTGPAVTLRMPRVGNCVDPIRDDEQILWLSLGEVK
ncbi:hypothetical protein JQN72_11755 [Phycicoccus sp. CSK15P-2]|uniref:hypothetical protein n=1 Tax=Phycicoccus sp. CSK15P-2 TaxID=2807627 RepID=UPI00194E40DE|nr:hypothetical protein [Phycicoccus sp. CSK15P-2]MBM6404917.1 hypothetical protein [Phycicoccus sp. CSK15P-2]